MGTVGCQSAHDSERPACQAFHGVAFLRAYNTRRKCAVGARQRKQRREGATSSEDAKWSGCGKKESSSSRYTIDTFFSDHHR